MPPPPMQETGGETGGAPAHSGSGAPSGTSAETGALPTSDVWIEGPEDGFVGATVGIRDVDGDGAAELAVGGRDRAWILTGPWRGGPIGAAASWSAAIDSYETALLPDLTGDGVPDLVAASWNGCSASVYAGPFVGAADAYATLPFEVGHSFVSCGDLDGDGDEELCLGSSDICSVHGQDPVAFVFALPLPPAGLQPEHALVRISAAGEDVEVGTADLDGDGRGEIVVGAPEALDRDGAVWLFRDPPPGDVDVAAADARWTGSRSSEAGGELGHGDLDGDGREDLVVGAPRWGDPRDAGYYGPPPEGRAWIATSDAGGPLGDLPITLLSAGVGGQLGTGLAVGDLDGDGDADLAVSDPVDSPPGPGRVAVYLGPLAPGTRTWRSADVMIVGWAPGDFHGLDLAIGDLDGDGRADLAIGGTGDLGLRERAGAVHLVFGAMLFP